MDGYIWQFHQSDTSIHWGEFGCQIQRHRLKVLPGKLLVNPTGFTDWSEGHLLNKSAIFNEIDFKILSNFPSKPPFSSLTIGSGRRSKPNEEHII